jgi:hypothetical protein
MVKNKPFRELKQGDIFQYQLADEENGQPFVGIKIGVKTACDLTNGLICNIRGASIVNYLPNAKKTLDKLFKV